MVMLYFISIFKVLMKELIVFWVSVVILKIIVLMSKVLGMLKSSMF